MPARHRVVRAGWPQPMRRYADPPRVDVAKPRRRRRRIAVYPPRELPVRERCPPRERRPHVRQFHLNAIGGIYRDTFVEYLVGDRRTLVHSITLARWAGPLGP